MQETKSRLCPEKIVSHSIKTLQNFKGKGKMTSESDIHHKRSEYNQKREENKFFKQQIQKKQKKLSTNGTNLKDNRITIFQIKNKDKPTLIK